MSERCYYKVDNTNSILFKRTNEFLDMEEQLRKKQKETIEAHIPKFSLYRGERGFTRIFRYTGFVFVDQDNIDAKVWNTKEVGGVKCSLRQTAAQRQEGRWRIFSSHLEEPQAGTWTIS